MLQVQNISFSYTEKTVIKNINFTVEKGKYCHNWRKRLRKKYTFKTYLWFVDLDEGNIFWNENRSFRSEI